MKQGGRPSMCKGQGVGESSVRVGSREVFGATGGNREGLLANEDRRSWRARKEPDPRGPTE